MGINLFIASLKFEKTRDVALQGVTALPDPAAGRAYYHYLCAVVESVYGIVIAQGLICLQFLISDKRKTNTRARRGKVKQ